MKSRFSSVTRSRLGPALLLVWGVVFGQACFTKEPSREETSAPSSSSAPPSPAPPPPTVEAEAKKDAPEQSSGGSVRDLGGPGNGRPAPAVAPSAPARAQSPAKARAHSAAPKAAAESAPRDSDDALENERGPSEPRELMQRLSDAYRGGAPDCPTAESRKKAVCDLAAQICQLMDRDPNVASVAEYCEEAKQRCSDAARRTAERCER